MAGPKLDSAGTIKLKVLDEALLHQQRINGLVEQYAMCVKRNMPAGAFLMNIKRQLPSLAANLKAQFGMISDQVTNIIITTSRGSSEQARVRAYRDGMAQIKQAIEIGMVLVKDKHAVEKKGGSGSGSGDAAAGGE